MAMERFSRRFGVNKDIKGNNCGSWNKYLTRVKVIITMHKCVFMCVNVLVSVYVCESVYMSKNAVVIQDCDEVLVFVGNVAGKNTILAPIFSMIASASTVIHFFID